MASRGIDFKKLAEVCRRNDVPRLLLFGSVARGEATDRSDVDLIAELPRDKSLLDVVRIEREFSVAIGRKVDLLTEEAISPYIRERIRDDLRVVYEAS
ncbi:MAG: nucleotidyltransferase domain-containing protein [Chloroflexi bacterium]|jgi:hypothetical protein|nr:nucleotidyltransferase domain-containing protein [Chloroflexota bacterium]